MALYVLFILYSFMKTAVTLDSFYNVKSNVYEMSQNYKTPKDSNVKFSFASYYNDHMVLQRGPKSAVIWGYSPVIGGTVLVTMGIKQYQSFVFKSGVPGVGIWRVKLDPVYEHGPFDIIASSADGENILLSDVLFGDVWLCSGQSNMVFSVGLGFNATEEIKDAKHYSKIRLFTVNRKSYSYNPQIDFTTDGILQKWSLASPDSVGHVGRNDYFSAVCWFYGKSLYQKLQYPIGLVSSNWGGTPVEAWSSTDALRKCNLHSDPYKNSGRHGSVSYSKIEGPNINSVLWNSMIHPLLNMTIYGVIWYQGEQNQNQNVHLYNCTFPTLIDDWRQKFYEGTEHQSDPSFPFGFVMLGPYNPDYTVDMGFPEIRWHQTADYGVVPNPRLKNTFMAVAMDTTDFLSPIGPIHPRDKQDVAARLVLSGLAIAYNQSRDYQGPIVTAVYTNSSSQQLDIIYNNSTTEIEVRTYHGFEVCCSYTGGYMCKSGSSWWLPASVSTWDKSKLTINTDACPSKNVTGVRYAWRTTPCSFLKCAVYSKESQLPAPPFLFYCEDFNKDGFHYVSHSSPVPIP